jgi:hypothetical protein
METYLKLCRIARRVGGKPDNWYVANMEWIGHHMHCDGGTPNRIDHGPFLGPEYWGGVELSRVILAQSDLDSED